MGAQDQHSFTLPEVIASHSRALYKIASESIEPVIFIVEGDPEIRELLCDFFEEHGLIVRAFESSESFLREYHPEHESCLLLDINLPYNTKGIESLNIINKNHHLLPIIVINGSSDITLAVETMKSGAADYVRAPIICTDLLNRIEYVLAHSCYRCKYSTLCNGRTNKLASLTPRQKQIKDMIVSGYPSKNIAADLHISQRTVENHRAAIMRKAGAKAIPDLVRMSLATPWHGTGECPPCFMPHDAVTPRRS